MASSSESNSIGNSSNLPKLFSFCVDLKRSVLFGRSSSWHSRSYWWSEGRDIIWLQLFWTLVYLCFTSRLECFILQYKTCTVRNHINFWFFSTWNWFVGKLNVCVINTPNLGAETFTSRNFCEFRKFCPFSRKFKTRKILLWPIRESLCSRNFSRFFLFLNLYFFLGQLFPPKSSLVFVQICSTSRGLFVARV